MGSLRRSLINVQRFLLGFSANRVSISRNMRTQYGWLSSYSTQTHNGAANSLNIDLSNEESKRRLFNRLLYRSRQRGFLELDLVLGNWVEKHIHSMDENGIKALVAVLDLENPDLWKWLTSQEPPPEAVSINPVFRAVHEKITGNLDNHASPETRAIPGQPWVRGWDDIKKFPGGPVTGNQVAYGINKEYHYSEANKSTSPFFHALLERELLVFME